MAPESEGRRREGQGPSGTADAVSRARSRSAVPDGAALGRSRARSSPVSADYRRGLRPPQFSIASLIALVTIVALVLALADVLGAYGTFWLVIFLVAVAAHVAGNALGRQLKEHGNRPLSDHAPTSARAQRAVRYAPRTRLSDYGALGFGTVALTMVGVVAAAVGGGYWLVHSMGDHFTISTLLVALIAFSVLGGIWSFLMVGFISVAVTAWRQSSRDK